MFKLKEKKSVAKKIVQLNQHLKGFGEYFLHSIEDKKVFYKFEIFDNGIIWCGDSIGY